MIGEKEERMLMTGRHTVADVRCVVCQTTVGWYYVSSERKESWLFALIHKLIATSPVSR
jgi:hypothetical protein